MKELEGRLKTGLIKWFAYRENSRVLCVAKDTQEAGIFREALADLPLSVDDLSLKDIEDRGFVPGDDKYDYVIAIEVLEYSHSPEKTIQFMRASLCEKGKLILGMDNRLGIRYFCGDRDQFTERSFDSIEGYVRADSLYSGSLAGRSYAKAEIEQMLAHGGFTDYRFYSVYPVLERPQIVFAQDYIPNEPLDIRIFPQYHYPDTVFLEEEGLYDTLIENGLFHTMANGFLIECSLDGVYANVLQVTMSVDRGREHALFTMVRRDDKVEKWAVYEEGIKRIEAIRDNHLYLKAHGINMVETVMEQSHLQMPFIKEVSALEYLRTILLVDKAAFLHKLDEFWSLILSSSEHVPYAEIDWERFEPYWNKKKVDDPNKDRWKNMAYGSGKEQESLGVILKRGYIDMVPLNCFYKEGQFMFYDQEVYVENLPAKVIMTRVIDLIYAGKYELYKELSIDELKDRYVLNECKSLFYDFVTKFLDDLRNDNKLSKYYKQVQPKLEMINSNRQRMNYSVEEYERIFRDIFKGVENRKLYLFGSGNFTKQFLSQFRNTYDVAGIIDNNEGKWGTMLDGVEITSPDILKTMEPGTYKVIICIKNYSAVMNQMKEMHIKDFSIYDSSLIYPRTAKKICVDKGYDTKDKKKYHVGYIAGVFDLFHVGHLNMFKRAKALCDYLIVGVVTDQGVIEDKKTMPFVPFEERIEMVRSCRYVDEAVEIPPDRSNTEEAYRRYQFNVQFSGSDYEYDKAWLAKKEFLQKQGSDLLFFPYTQSTSSTKLKDMINKKLM